MPPAATPAASAPAANLSKRKAKRAEKAAREQAKVDYDRQRGDTEFDSWLGEIAPPKLPAGRRKQISDDDED
jgi:hypothetical protein